MKMKCQICEEVFDENQLSFECICEKCENRDITIEKSLLDALFECEV